jgi:phage tail sheath protein FI
VTTYLSPGVYIEEIPSGPQPIAAVSPSVLAIVGATRKGPRMEPTRVTGWGDFDDRFGGAVAGMFTPEAVAGYFENGGPAAYIVRVDPSDPAVWLARDQDGDDVFRIEASSPGAWADDLTVNVVPSVNGGLGRPWTSTATAVDGTDIAVVSTVGLRIGDAIESADGTFTADVDTITGNTLGVTVGGGAAAVDQQLLITQSVADISLATASGIEVGDVVVIEVPGAVPAYERVTAIDPQPGAIVVTLAGAADVPGGAIARRTASYRAALSAAGLTEVNLGHLVFADADHPDGADMADGARLHLAGGLMGQWTGDHFELPDHDATTGTPARFPTGTVLVEGPVEVAVYRETGLSLDNPTLDDLAARYGWVPDGQQLTLTDGANPTVVEKSGATFTVVAGDLAHIFTQVDHTPAGTDVLVTSWRAPRVGDLVDLTGGTADKIVEVHAIGGNRYHIVLEAETADAGASGLLEAFQATRVAPYRFGLVVAQAGAVVEEFTNLALAEGHSHYYARDGMVNEVSTLVTVGARLAAGDIGVAELPVRVDLSAQGTTQALTAQDLIEGIGTLEQETEPAMLVVPDHLTLDDPMLQGAVVGAMTTHAEEFRRYAIVDAPREANDQDLVDWRLEHVTSPFAGVYAPHVQILNLDDTAPERFRFVPPSGHVAGVFARTDLERGVHKAPANERVNGILGLDQAYTQRRQDLLNPNAVNLIRSFPGRGRRIWGARNATDDTQWRYVNVRRLFNVIETSVERGTQWVVFEPNTSSSWLRVRVSVENFLDTLWRAGALAGSSPEEAYRVRVGLGETMTEAQIDLGLIIVRVAVAPAKPAEFVVFQFTHKQISE